MLSENQMEELVTPTVNTKAFYRKLPSVNGNETRFHWCGLFYCLSRVCVSVCVWLCVYLLWKVEGSDAQRPEAAEHGEEGQTQVVLRDHQREVALAVCVAEVIKGGVLGFKHIRFTPSNTFLPLNQESATWGSRATSGSVMWFFGFQEKCKHFEWKVLLSTFLHGIFNKKYLSST